jgi:group I intron endonuclease
MATNTTGIYCIKSPSGSVYIGQSHTIEKRFRQYRLLHCKDQFRIYNSLRKHGVDNHEFSIIYSLPIDISQDVLNEYEQLFMNRYRELGFDLMNLREAGSRGLFSEETKKKISLANMGRPSAIKGKKLSPERVEQMKYNRQFQVYSAESKEKISQSLIDYHKNNPKNGISVIKSGYKPKYKRVDGKFPEELKIRYSKERSGDKNIFYGKTHTNEAKLKMSKDRIGKYVGSKNGRARKIIQMDLEMSQIKTFNSIIEASQELNVSRTSINCAVAGYAKTAHGFKWKYA